LLDYLKVENFAVVEKVEIEFSPGLNVLTGETGTGKSIVIGAVNHFFNKKITESAIRGGGENNKLVVEAMFSQEEDELVLRREVGRKKSQAFINGQLVPFAQLKEKAEGLFNIYGQNEHVFLLNPANHRLFLDEFCGNQKLLDRLSECYSRFREAVNELEALKKTNEKAAEKIDYIYFQISEIENLEMGPGDDEALEQQVKILASAEEILSRSGALVEAFYQDDKSVYSTIAEQMENLEFLGDIYPELATLKDEVGRFYDLLPELSSTISHLTGKVEYNEDELNRCEEKLSKLNRLKSKYKVDFEGLLQKLEELKGEKELISNMNFSIREKQKEVEKRFEAYKEVNRELRDSRNNKAGQLSSVVEKELAKLEMKKARFEVRIEENEPDPSQLNTVTDKGTDTLEFYFSTNPGQEPGRIKDVASGGELSRLMLVLKSIIDSTEHATYIFDEIDTGIGGKTAEFVGEKLRRISQRNQVICISHLPQIASFADSHFRITKEFRKGETFSYVTELSDEERAGEIGRLMVGSDVGDDALKAARNLLEKNRK